MIYINKGGLFYDMIEKPSLTQLLFSL